MNHKAILRGATALAMAMAAVPAVYAQQTTSDIRGQVVDELGAPLAGASVTVIDTRTNQTRQASTNTQGQFSARNLSVGGPYTVTVAATDRQAQTAENVIVSVSGTTNLDFQLGTVSDDARTLETVTVTGTRATALQTLATGPSSTFGLDQLSALPSINRDFRETISLDPRIVIDETNDSAISCIGGNSRGNSFTIDGVRNGDGFGLNASGFPSRNSTPIPFDSIQEIAVEFSPLDVEYGAFTGCNINVVSVSGTNEFHGSTFFVYSNDSLLGDSIDGQSVGFQDFDNFNWGGQLSGPIIKDKLFFSVTYEQFQDTAVEDDGPAELGFGDPVGASLENIQTVQGILENQFGFETGGIINQLAQDNTRVLARLDWIINDQHRAEFSYSYLDESFENPEDLGGFFFTNPIRGGAPDSFGFRNNARFEGTESNLFSLRLFSDWTENLSTEVRVSRSDITDIQNPIGGGEAQDGTPIPRFAVATDGLAGNFNAAFVVNGPGFFRAANDLQTELDQIKLKADYAIGNHTLTAGYELDSLEVFNLFAQNATGSFIFDSIGDLQAGQAGQIFGTGSFSGDINDAAATFSRNINSVYLQDKWQITSDLELLFGLRYDFYNSSDTPPENADFIARYGFSNAFAFDGLDILQPRIGFNYESPLDLFGQTTLSGGVGIFSGGDPTVFFSNAFSNFGSGLAQNIPIVSSFGADGAPLTFNGTCTADDLVVTGTPTGVPACLVALQQSLAGANLGRTDAVDPNLEIPSITRYSFDISHVTDFRGAAGGFFDDWSVNVSYIHSIAEDTLDFIDLTQAQVGVAPDGRPTFNAIDPLNPGCDAVFTGPRSGFSGPADQLAVGGPCDIGGQLSDARDILLTNAVGSDGNTDTVALQLSKRFDYQVPSVGDGAVSLRFGYAFTDSENVRPLTSAQATSNFENAATFDQTRSVVAASSDFSRHNVTLSARIEQDFFTDLTTALTLRYRGRSGNRFSYTFDGGGNDFGDIDNEDRNLLFIPELGSPLVNFGSPADEAQFNQFVSERGLERFRGQILPRNAFEEPFNNDLDLRFEQEIPTFLNNYLPGARGLFFVDIDNVLNLIDDGATVVRINNRGNSDVPEAVPVIDVTDNGDGTFTFFGFQDDLLDPEETLDVITGSTLWQIQFGVRFEF